MDKAIEEKLSKYLSPEQIQSVVAALSTGKRILLTNKLNHIQQTALKCDLAKFFHEVAYTEEDFTKI